MVVIANTHHVVGESMDLGDAEIIIVVEGSQYGSSALGAEIEGEVAFHVTEIAFSVFNGTLLEVPVIAVFPHLLKYPPRLSWGEIEEELV